MGHDNDNLLLDVLLHPEPHIGWDVLKPIFLVQRMLWVDRLKNEVS